MYDKIESFDKLCKFGCEFILSNVKSHPFLIVDQSKPNLYELVDELEWIKDYLYKFNELGFYTVMSQPGLDYPVKIFPTRLDYKNSFLDKSLSNNYINLFGVKQRAEVQGFIKFKYALKLFEILKDDPNIIIGISTKSNEIKISNNYNLLSINKYATISYEIIEFDEKTNFKKIRFMENEDMYNIEIKNKLVQYDRNKKLSMMKHLVRRYFEVRNYSLKKKHIPNLIDTDIVGISMMNVEFNSNDYFWKKILNSLYIVMKSD